MRTLFARFAAALFPAVLALTIGCTSTPGSASGGSEDPGSGSGPGGGPGRGTGSTSGTPGSGDGADGGLSTPAPSTADYGFRPQKDGFAFANYADEPNLNVFGANELRRMFGDEVCASLNNGVCQLAPQGQDWADHVNSALQSGHCEGFAVLSLLFYNKWIDPAPFGADATNQLALSGNGALNHELAYWYATQFLKNPVVGDTHSFKAADAVNYLLQTFSSPSPDSISRIGLARVADDGSLAGGHAVTPYAVLDGAQPGTKKIMVYDNNWPGEERAIDVDIAANRWSYTAGVNPSDPGSLYVGDLSNKNKLYVATVHPRLGEHPCPFCAGSPVTGRRRFKGSDGGVADAGTDWGDGGSEAQGTALLVNGDLDPLIEDESGHRVGRVNGELLNEIPGAIIMPGFGGGALWTESTPFGIYLPAEVDAGTGHLTITIQQRQGLAGNAGATDGGAADGDASDAGIAAAVAGRSVRMFAAGTSVGIDYAASDTVAGDKLGMPSDARTIQFMSAGTSSPTLSLAQQVHGGGTLRAKVRLDGLPPGSNVGLANDPAGGVALSLDGPVHLELNVTQDTNDGMGDRSFAGSVDVSGGTVGVDLTNTTPGAPVPVTVTPADGGAPMTVPAPNTYVPPPIAPACGRSDDCSVHATCTDTTNGAFTCACNSGYSGDGVTCSPGAGPPPPPPAAPVIQYTFTGAPSVTFIASLPAKLLPPTNEGGIATAFGVTPNLPAGLVLDARTGGISGTPTSPSAGADYTVTANNAGGSATATLHLTVNPPPPTIAYSPKAFELTRWTKVPLITPSISGTAQYSVAPALPPGLTFDTATGTIAGTPTALSARVSYTVTATNAYGSWPVSISIAVVCANGASSCDAPPARPYRDEVMADGPAAYYRLNDATSNAADETGKYDGTYLNRGAPGAIPTLIAGAIANDPNQAVQFGGPLQLQTGWTQNAVTAESVEAWFNVPSGTGDGQWVIFGDRGSGSLGSSGQSLTLFVGQASVSWVGDSDGIIGGQLRIPTPQPIFDGKWHHLVGTWAGSAGQPAVPAQFGLYLDGVPIAADASTNNFGFTAPLTGLGPADIGFHAAWNAYFPGAIDEVAVYPTALGAAQVKKHYLLGTGQALPAAPSIDYGTGSTVSATAGQAVVVPAPTNSSGAADHWGVQPALPPGLAIDPSTGVISGVPAAASATADYLVTATNAGGAASATLRLTVTPGVASLTSCAAILASQSNAADGLYTIQSPGGGAPLSVYCDMTSAGGGWTEVVDQDVNVSPGYQPASVWQQGYNTSTPNSGQYSILNLMSGLKSGASYELRIDWPSQGGSVQWTQVEDPLTSGQAPTVSNLVEDPPNQVGCGSFRGLASSTSGQPAALHGDSNNGCWFWAIGTSQSYGAGIPSASGSGGTNNTTHARLWVR